eukprot:scaffold43322_cov28-Tisochrysis_lutea.AAC.7
MRAVPSERLVGPMCRVGKTQEQLRYQADQERFRYQADGESTYEFASNEACIRDAAQASRRMPSEVWRTPAHLRLATA